MISTFSAGTVTMGFVIASLFFLRFWKSSRDTLFLWFAAAFVLLGIGQATLTFTEIPREERSPLYLFRLSAFVLIIIAIWRKNRGAGRG